MRAPGLRPQTAQESRASLVEKPVALSPSVTACGPVAQPFRRMLWLQRACGQNGISMTFCFYGKFGSLFRRESYTIYWCRCTIFLLRWPTCGARLTQLRCQRTLSAVPSTFHPLA